MGRPNFDYMARQQRDIASYVGDVAILRRYVSADALSPSSLAAGGGAEERLIGTNEQHTPDDCSSPPKAADRSARGALAPPL